MSVTELFSVVSERGRYKISYLVDGWTQDFVCEVGSPTEAMMVTQNKLGDICGVTYVEKE